jgi:hypothetical protein
MEVPESCSENHIEIILSFSSPEYISCCFESFHSADSILDDYTDTGYEMVLFFLFFGEWIFL